MGADTIGSGAATRPDDAAAAAPPPPSQLPEVEAYASLLVLLLLTDGKHWAEVGRAVMNGCDAMTQLSLGKGCLSWDPVVTSSMPLGMPCTLPSCCSQTSPQAKEVATAAVQRLGSFNRRTLDVLAARVYHYYSLAHERTGTLPTIRRWVLVSIALASHECNTAGRGSTVSHVLSSMCRAPCVELRRL